MSIKNFHRTKLGTSTFTKKKKNGTSHYLYACVVCICFRLVFVVIVNYPAVGRVQTFDAFFDHHLHHHHPPTHMQHRHFTYILVMMEANQPTNQPPYPTAAASKTALCTAHLATTVEQLFSALLFWFLFVFVICRA